MNSCNHLLSPPNHQAPRKLSVKCLKGTSQRGMGYKDKEREKKKSADTCTHRHTSLKYDVTVCWSLDVIPIRTLSLVKHYISMFLEQTSLCKCGCWCVDVCVSALNLQNIGRYNVLAPEKNWSVHPFTCLLLISVFVHSRLHKNQRVASWACIVSQCVFV